MGRFSDAQLDLVRQRADIVEVIGERVALERKGRDFVARCPFHEEKTPSFYVNPQKQAWYCHGSCKKGGDVFTFVRDIDKLRFPEAVRLIARRYGVEIEEETPEEKARARHRADLLDVLNRTADFYRRRLWAGDATAERARAFLAKRGVTEETAKAFSLGVAPPGGTILARKAGEVRGMLPLLQELGLVRNGRDFFQDRLIFPIADESARCIGFGGRVLGEVTKFEPKFKNSSETPGIFEKKRVLYGLDKARQTRPRPERLVVVEGYLDVVVAHQAGCTNVVAALGVGFTREHTSLVKRFADGVVLLLDGDAAGRERTRAILEDLLGRELDARVASLPDGHDPDDYVLKHGKEGFDSFVREQSRDLFQFLVDQVVQVRDGQVRPEAVRECARLLGKFQDDIRHQLSLKLVAERLRFPEDLLRREALRFREKGRLEQSRPQGRDSVRDADRADAIRELADPQIADILGPHACAGEAFEVALLEALVARPSAALGIAAEVRADDFTRGPLREVASVVLRLARDPGNELSPPGSDARDDAFMNRVLAQTGDTGTAHGIVSRLLARINEHPDKQYDRELEGVATLVARRNKRRAVELRRELEQASARGDWAELDRLLAEKTRLEREKDAARRAQRS